MQKYCEENQLKSDLPFLTDYPLTLLPVYNSSVALLCQSMIFLLSNLSNLVELRLIFHSLWHMFPVCLITSGVLDGTAELFVVLEGLPTNEQMSTMSQFFFRTLVRWHHRTLCYPRRSSNKRTNEYSQCVFCVVASHMGNINEIKIQKIPKVSRGVLQKATLKL